MSAPRTLVAGVVAGAERLGPAGDGESVPASQQSVRRHNRSILLRRIAAEPRRSRAQLATATGMARATVSALVDDLLDSGLIRELDADRGVRGRPARPLVLNPDGPAGLGIEINVDYISVCVMDLTGQVRGRRTAVSPHRAAGPARVLRRGLDLAQRVLHDTKLPLAGAAVALPGLVDPTGRVRWLPNLSGWNDFDCGARASGVLGVPTRVDNEANLAAIAEARAGRQGGDFILVSGEVGVGAGIVVGGELYRGVRGFAGELGHLVVDPAGPPCGCGSRGCLEQYVGQEALLRAAGLPSEPATGTAVPEGAGTLLVRAAEAGDRRAHAALAQAGHVLGTALAGIVNVLDLPTVVLGGLYSRLAPWLIESIGAELAARVVSRGLTPTGVVVSSLGADAAVVGAARGVVDEVIFGGAG